MSKPKYVADLETTTDPNDCRVWGWGLVEIGHWDVTIGQNMDSLMNLILSETCIVYFHNEKFDGEFVLIWLYENGYSLNKSGKNLSDYEFTTVLSDKGQFYLIEIKTPKSTVLIRDSLKILPLKVEEIAKGFGMSTLKGEIDYDKYREPGYIITDTERKYIEHDVLIVAQGLEYLFKEGLTASTQASNALQDYKKIISPKKFKRWFPKYPEWKHDEMAQSYKGGFTYCNPKFAGKEIKEGIVLDKNSMYPWVMYTKPLPVGDPIFFEGKYEYDSLCPLYIQMIRCQFDLKKDKIPTIQIKYPGPWNNVDYLETSAVKTKNKDGTETIIETEVELCLTNIDLELFFENYNVYNVEYLGGYKFRQSYGLFTDYIDKWYKRKEQATKEKNKPQRQISKLMLNALYGKFGTSPYAYNKYPYYEDGKIVYRDEKEIIEGKLVKKKESKKYIYVPIASFITSYAREECIRSAQKCYERFLYADTDSLHLIGLEIPNLEIDPYKLGAWKCEGIFKRGKYLRAKSYVEEIYGYYSFNGEGLPVFDELNNDEIARVLETKSIPICNTQLKITCAGMPVSCYNQVTFENFSPGTTYTGKLKPTHVKGGIVLMATEFTIRG